MESEQYDTEGEEEVSEAPTSPELEVPVAVDTSMQKVNRISKVTRLQPDHSWPESGLL